MSEVQPVQNVEIRRAIARAAEATGADFDFLLAQAKMESSLDPQARARTSSAAGLYQFIGSTWLDTLDRHGAEHGFGWANQAIENGQMRDPAMRAQVMALRLDPQASALMAGELARDNGMALQNVLGRQPDHAELYLAHFLGKDGATKFLSAMQANPAQSAAALMPRAANANRPVFYNHSGVPRSLDAVMEHLRARFDRALDETGSSKVPHTMSEITARGISAGPDNRPVAREFHTLAASRPNFRAATPDRFGAFSPAPAPPSAPRLSMADMLQQTFTAGNNKDGKLSDHIQNAYGRLKAFGL